MHPNIHTYWHLYDCAPLDYPALACDAASPPGDWLSDCVQHPRCVDASVVAAAAASLLHSWWPQLHLCFGKTCSVRINDVHCRTATGTFAFVNEFDCESDEHEPQPEVFLTKSSACMQPAERRQLPEDESYFSSFIILT